MPQIQTKLKRNKLSEFWDIKSLNNFQKLAKICKIGICECYDEIPDLISYNDKRGKRYITNESKL